MSNFLRILQKYFLPLLAEVGKAQMLRGLVFLLFAQADHNQYHDGNHIGQHLDQIGHVAGNGNAKQAGQELIQQYSTPNR